jgi:hypothetical protein
VELVVMVELDLVMAQQELEVLRVMQALEIKVLQVLQAVLDYQHNMVIHMAVMEQMDP